MAQQSSTRSLLQAGQALHVHASHGMTIVAAQGSVTVHGAMISLAGQTVRPRVALREGESHIVQDAGWIAVSSEGDAEVFCLHDNTRTGSILARLRFWLIAGLRHVSAGSLLQKS